MTATKPSSDTRTAPAKADVASKKSAGESKVDRNATFRVEVAWLVFGLACAWFAGVAIGFTALPVVYLVGYSLWLLFRKYSILRWLVNGAPAEGAPDASGLAGEIVQQIHREKKYSRKQRKRYRHILSQFSGLASQLPDATLVLDENNQIRWASRASQALLGINPETDVGQRIENLVRNPELREFLDSNETEIEMVSPLDRGATIGLKRNRTKDNNTVLIATDITQRVQVREMRKVFVGDVSHELRTPLTVMRGYLEMLEDSDDLDSEQQRWLERVSAQARRMQNIIDDLLDLSQLEAREQDGIESEQVDFGALVARLVDSLEDTHSSQIAVDIDAELHLLGSERDLYSICSNLVANAIKYAGEEATILVRWRAEPKGDAVFSVTDNGPGIEQRHLARLSERFYRIDRSRSRESGGTGLGLAIVKHAALLHDAELSIQSIPGSGSTFSVTFPPERVIRNTNRDIATA